MNILRKSNIFNSKDSFSIKEYIYLLNYTNELMKKFENNILDPLLLNFSILVLKIEENWISNYILNQCLNLSKFCSKLNFINNTTFINTSISDFLITIGEYNIETDNHLQINKEVFSVIFTLAKILNENNENLNNSKNIKIPEEEIIIEFIDKQIYSNLLKEILEKKEYLSFLKNTEINIKVVPHREFFFLIFGIIIMMIKKSL